MIAVERKPAIMKSDVGLELISLITLGLLLVAQQLEEGPGDAT